MKSRAGLRQEPGPPRMMRSVMHLASDYIHTTPRKGRCRVRIFEPDDDRDAPVIVLTELKGNPGQSVTNAAEGLVAAVLAQNRIMPPAVVIEHYEDGARGTPQDPHTFDLVLFEKLEAEEGATGTRYNAAGARWKPLDRASVEALVGRKL